MIKFGVFYFLLLTSIFASQNITICGTGDNQKLLKALALAYEEEHPDISINIPKSVGSGGGIKNTALGKCDIGRVARPIKKREIKYNLKYLLFAYSPVVFVVNPSVEKITNLTTQNILDIYSGKIKQWNYFDSSLNGKIYVIKRESGDSATTVLNENINGFKNIKNRVGKTIYNTPETLRVLNKYQGTIGYISLSETIDTKLKVLNFNGTNPTNNKSYTLFTPYGLVYKDNLNKTAKEFIDFIQTQKAKNIIESYGAISTLNKND